MKADEKLVREKYAELRNKVKVHAALKDQGITLKRVNEILANENNKISSNKPDRAELQTLWNRLQNKKAIAECLGVSDMTVARYMREYGIDDRPVIGGKLTYIEENKKPLPPEGRIARYILTSAQNNTRVHRPFLKNLETYARFINAEIMVARFTYNKASYSSQKSVKPGKGPTANDKGEAWYDKALEPYFCDDTEFHGSGRWELAPGLLWCAEMNILPTASRPLSGLENYTGSDSAIFPHAKIALESVATAPHEPPKINYTTGSVTQRNYVQKKAGLKAEFHHAYAALIVEVNDQGDWWVRQLNADNKGSFYDCPALRHSGVVYVSEGEVEAVSGIEAINWGDAHFSEIDENVAWINWKDGGIIDQLRPNYQFIHDAVSFRERSHHEIKKFGRMYQKFIEGIDSVESGIDVTANYLKTAYRDWCDTVVINSNHDRHGERWLDECDYRHDLLNAEFFLEAQLARVRSIKQNASWDFAVWALKRAGVSEDIIFHPRNESFKICHKHGGIECGMHGDDGPDGARGTTGNLSKIGARVNKGHDHKATIMDGVYSAGSCRLNFEYMHGPSSHSISHIITYPNGKRQIITLRNLQWRA